MAHFNVIWIFFGDNVGICYIGALTEVNICLGACNIVNKYVIDLTLLTISEFVGCKTVCILTQLVLFRAHPDGRPVLL